jgi:hypothetical protein
MVFLQGECDRPPGVGPESRNLLKFLTCAPCMITLERWIFPYPVTSRDKVYDHATRRPYPARIRFHLVPITSRHTAGTPRLAPSSCSLYTERLATEASAIRSLAPGLAVPSLAGLATGSGVRTTSNGRRLAEETLPSVLATIESARQAGTTGHRSRGPVKKLPEVGGLHHHYERQAACAANSSGS